VFVEGISTPGDIPPLSSKEVFSDIAQLVEHLIVNQSVVGSSPTIGASLVIASVAQW
jgi:hypothetical protein